MTSTTLRMEVETIRRCHMNIIAKALRFAAIAHHGQRREGGDPFIVHPVMTATILALHGVIDEHVLAAALLHDVLEDTPISDKRLEAEFGARIVGWIREITKDARGEFAIRSKQAAMIKMADRIHNLSTCKGEKLQGYPKKTDKLIDEYGHLFQAAHPTLFTLLRKTLRETKMRAARAKLSTSHTPRKRESWLDDPLSPGGRTMRDILELDADLSLAQRRQAGSRRRRIRSERGRGKR